jgi:hypothetical protein
VTRLAAASLVLFTAATGLAQNPGTVFLSPDSPRWALSPQARVTTYLGRPCLFLDGGLATVKDFALRDGVVDVDVATPAARGFFGFEFRIADSGANAELVYLRQHKSGLPDAMQYTPILNTGRNWQIYSGPGFTAAVDIPRNAWFHLRLVVEGAHASLYVNDMRAPALVMSDLKSGVQRGQLALFVLEGATYFSHFSVRPTPDAPWERHLPPMPPGTLVHWRLSPEYDALARDLERPLSPAEQDSMPWQPVDAEAPGFVVINRYRASPHVDRTYDHDFSTRLAPQPGTAVVYARTTIESDRAEVKKLAIGYSDDVSVFLNGQILFRGRSAQDFRDPEFLGIMSPDDDALYLPLRQGSNELVLAVSELGGGWGFICRLTDR